MASKVKINTVQTARSVAPAFVSSRGRGRPIADLVREFEKTDPELVREKGLSGAALQAADLIRAMRKAAKLSQAGLAESIGVSQSRISEIEAGLGTQGPTWDVMSRIASACGMRLVLENQRAEYFAEETAVAMGDAPLYR
jgi:DNA-binding XRE family transcriptional regulator